jgi:hypothetical protein
VDDGHKAQAITETASSAPNMATGSDPLWVRVTSDGTTVTARVLAQASEPTDGQWSGTSDIYSSSGFDMIGGMIGFASRVGVGSVDDVTVRSWNTSTSSFDVAEHVDTFDVDGSNRSSVDPAHDAAGNMTFDGVQKFTYDG